MKYKKLSTIAKKLLKMDKEKWDATYLAGEQLSFHDKTCEIVVPTDLFTGGAAYEMTPWALQQACLKSGHIPYGYAKDCPPDLRATNLNHWREALPDSRKWFLRFYQDRCRAVLSERYGPLDNSDVAQHLLKNMGDGYELINPYFDADSLHLRIKGMADPEDDNFAYGVYVGNGETGNRALTVAGFIQRHSCANSIIITEHEWRLTHIKPTKNEYLLIMQVWVNMAMQLAVDQREKMAEAAMEEIPDFASVVDAICKKKGLVSTVKENVLIGSEGSKTTMGLVNGLSWAAQQQDNHDLQADMEILAGDVLKAGAQGLFHRVRVPALVSMDALENAQEEVA